LVYPIILAWRPLCPNHKVGWLAASAFSIVHVLQRRILPGVLKQFLADRTDARSMIGCWHDTVVCL